MWDEVDDTSPILSVDSAGERYHFVSDCEEAGQAACEWGSLFCLSLDGSLFVSVTFC